MVALAEHFADLMGAVAHLIAQQQNAAEIFGQAVDGFVQTDGFIGIGRAGGVGFVQRDGGDFLFSAQQINGLVLGDEQDRRAGIRVGRQIVAVDGLPDGDQRFMDGVFGIGIVLQDAAGSMEHQIAVGPMDGVVFVPSAVVTAEEAG